MAVEMEEDGCYWVKWVFNCWLISGFIDHEICQVVQTKFVILKNRHYISVLRHLLRYT